MMKGAQKGLLLAGLLVLGACAADVPAELAAPPAGDATESDEEGEVVDSDPVAVEGEGEGPDLEEDLGQTSQALELPYKGGYDGPFNKAHQLHYNVCADLKSDSIPLRYDNGKGTGSTLLRSALVNTAGHKCDVGSGPLQLDVHEVLTTAGGGHLVFQRGGYGYENGAEVKYGWLRTSDLVMPTMSGDTPLKRSVNGRQKCVTQGKKLRVDVKPIDGRMEFMHVNDNDGSNGYASYGDPSAQKGSGPVTDNNKPGRYTYLTWSWVNVEGGGQVRTLLKQGDLVEPCAVPPVKLASVKDYNGQGEPVRNGWVKAIYVRKPGKKPLYGWMVFAHQYNDGAEVGPVVLHYTK